nr:uncharacterized protein LOC113804430 [Penaeus vannamei]
MHQVETASLEDRRITVRHLAQDVKISFESVDKIIYEHLHMQKLSAQWVPRFTHIFPEAGASPFSQGSFSYMSRKSGFLGRLIMQDETWAQSNGASQKLFVLTSLASRTALKKKLKWFPVSSPYTLARSPVNLRNSSATT